MTDLVAWLTEHAATLAALLAIARMLERQGAEAAGRERGCRVRVAESADDLETAQRDVKAARANFDRPPYGIDHGA